MPDGRLERTRKTLPPGYQYLDIGNGVGHRSETCPAYDDALVTATTSDSTKATGFVPCPECLAWNDLDRSEH